MRKLLWTLPVLALGLVVLTPNDVQGFGKKKAADCAPTCASAPAPQCVVGYVDKVVTSYQPQTVEEEVEVTVYRPVTREVAQPYKYHENVQVVTPTKQTVKWWEQVVVEEAHLQGVQAGCRADQDDDQEVGVRADEGDG